MKKIFLIIAATATLFSAQAKKVKFTVEMGADSINPTGMHIIGSFQDEIGKGADFDHGVCKMTIEPNGRHTFYADLPANKMYEFAFVNGDGGYGLETPPPESRVDYDLATGVNSNRWFYLDSTNIDTTFIGGMHINENAPQGKTLVRALVDCKSLALGSALPFIQTPANGYSNTTTHMYSHHATIYEAYWYIDSTQATTQWKAVNETNTPEAVNGSCVNTVSNRRESTISTHVVLDTVCFAACTKCFSVGINESIINTVAIYPNPASTNIYIANAIANNVVNIYTITGKKMYGAIGKNNYTINTTTWANGIYIVQVNNTIHKIVIE